MRSNRILARHFLRQRLSSTMLIGYMRVSKSDGSQTVDLQRDALIIAGVDPAQIYEDRASGRLDARPGLDATLKALSFRANTDDNRYA